jgi:ribosomal protein L19E
LNLRSKRRLAAAVLGVGAERIIFDPEAEDLIQDAITRSTIRGLIGTGAI